MRRTILVLACLLLAACPVFGQLRDVGGGIGAPGQLRGVGQSSLDTFRSYSSGAPAGSSLGQEGGNALSVPLAPGSYSAFRGGGGDSGSALGGSSVLSPGFSGRSAPGITIGDSGGGAALSPQNYLLRSINSRYAPPSAENMALTDAVARQGLVTSLAPRGEGIYSECMKQGEDRFKQGDYLKAFSRFEGASFIGHDDAESLLSMSHAQFAMGSYPVAGHYLCRAIARLPNLAQMKLSPKGFYGLSSDYVQRVIDLEEYTKRNPQEANGWLLLAYYSWFDDPSDAAKAGRALGRAIATSTDPKLVQAVETFYESMLRTGKVTGRLVAATQPSTQPAVAKP